MFLGMGGLGAAGTAAGAAVQRTVGRTLGSGVARLLPAGDQFQIYSVTGSFPEVSAAAYRLEVSGLVHHPLRLTLADLQSLPRVSLVRTFQCVTGWRVPDVHWEGVHLGDVLAKRGRLPDALDAWTRALEGDGSDIDRAEIQKKFKGDIVVVLKPEAADAMRFWTDITGKYRVRGQMMKILVAEQKVRILKDTGKYTTVPFARLSEADRTFVAHYTIEPSTLLAETS